MSIPETSYGLRKRLACLQDWISRTGATRVLDVGCGTGANVTVPLAQAFPQAQFVGVDEDPGTIRHAESSHRLGNLRFSTRLPEGGLPSDFVIASEVIEHVEDPDGFLEACLKCLAPGGHMAVTLPNGLGPFEGGELGRKLLEATGLFRPLWALRRAFRRTLPPVGGGDTLADSPHVNYFTFRSIRRLFTAHGLSIVEYRPRTWLCGFGFDSIIRGERACRWNAAVADVLPPPLVSGWMFLLARVPGAPSRNVYVRSGYGRWRRRLTGRRGE